MRPALLFDLDGTLIETDDLHREVFADLMKPYGIDVTYEFYREKVHGRLNLDIFADILPDHPDPQALSEEKEARFRAVLPQPTPAMPGAERLISEARVAGWGLAVVTNAPRLNAEAMLDAVQLRDAFEVIVIGEECAEGKPHPEPYLEAMRQLKVAPDHAIAFEDSPSGMRAAKASGAYAVGIRSQVEDAVLTAAGAAETHQDFRTISFAALRAQVHKGENK
jgi:HAD superfamily hydrolase (TIGR01509 family)